MKTIQKKKRFSGKKLFLIIGGVVLLLTAYSALAYTTSNLWPFIPATQSQQTESDGSPSSEPQEQTPNTPPTNDNNVKEQSNNTSTPQAAGDLIISAAAQNEGIVQIRALIGSVVGTGTCALTLSSGTNTVTRSVGIQALPSSSTCQGFDIPVSELTPGVWDILITASYNSQTVSVTGKVEVR